MNIIINSIITVLTVCLYNGHHLDQVPDGVLPVEGGRLAPGGHGLDLVKLLGPEHGEDGDHHGHHEELTCQGPAHLLLEVVVAGSKMTEDKTKPFK